MKLAFVDIGELGWSLYISAHVRWLKRNTDDLVAIITYPDRKCLYEGMADIILDVPKNFYNLFPIQNQHCLGLIKVLPIRLKNYFLPYIPEGYAIPANFIFRCHNLNFSGYIYEPYKYSKEIKATGEILVFPRYRTSQYFSTRNLPKIFYFNLLKEICDENRDCVIRTMGTQSGAYNITEKEVARNNYVNWVGKTSSVQAVIDRCQIAVCAIGGTSVLPKLTLLQGVPTFIIGHEPGRFKNRENWQKTEVGFYTIEKHLYGDFNFDDCINKVALFIKGVKHETIINRTN